VTDGLEEETAAALHCEDDASLLSRALVPVRLADPVRLLAATRGEEVQVLREDAEEAFPDQDRDQDHLLRPDSETEDREV
jgi:hypothetical protein